MVILSDMDSIMEEEMALIFWDRSNNLKEELYSRNCLKEYF